MADQHILIVEGDTDLVVVLVEVLEREGYRVSVAPRCVEALAVLRQGDVDLIVADSVLRGGNGRRYRQGRRPARGTGHHDQRRAGADRAVARRVRPVHRETVPRRPIGSARGATAGVARRRRRLSCVQL